MPFATLVSDARAFLGELKANNSRDWFTAHKDRYDRDLKAPSLALLDVVAADLQRQTGKPVETKLFRPQRDIRFSKDKTPYKTHLHMMWTVGDGLGKTAFFFGIEPDRTLLGGGAMGFDKDRLAAFRKRAEGPKGADLMRLMTEMQAHGIRFSDPELKRVPQPYPADHPRGDLLRRKSFTFWKALSDDSGNPAKALRLGFAEVKPAQDWLMALR
ncbi:hypothetical protein TG4357_03123 [Thalassovita gelatinovora]|uniref:TIGR02453 family protein n=1 Tax=Thalassovita gelatinovora TaxID=53501 RepID=A0A0P1FIL8_THAGE|nr:DUF2461 domain-containing protein [Thalassovita gelatinovora]QIZ82093.1 TIGR02453 family protein [Thalassovita gelatinovora]CUH67643.1 hypothetical protein TG4357_03123 [Thalassovita gelatinovora]SEP70267.1 TIGR02453 family protein [Thalassovita gelatinovora]